MSDDIVMVEMTVKVQTGESGSGYPQWETLAEFALPCDRPVAFGIFQTALGDVTAPRVTLTLEGDGV